MTQAKNGYEMSRAKAAKIKILLVEDHKVVRKGLKVLLELEGDIEVVEEAENGIEAIKLARVCNADIIVMDIALPRMNGLEATRVILRENPKMKILVLSAHSEDGYIDKFMQLGVAGYLVKHCSPGFFIEAIREISQGRRFFSPIVASRLVSPEDKKPTGKRLDRKPRHSVTPELSDRENQVLQLIAEGRANKQIANDLEISIKTVEKHRQNVMKKLHIHDVAGLVRYAFSEGIVSATTLQD
jgi:DNA-binding NarL/FixJ family response regulator